MQGIDTKSSRTQCRRVRERLFSNALSPAGGNKYSIKFDNSMTKDIQLNALCLEEQSVGVPTAEVIETTMEETTNAKKILIIMQTKQRILYF